MEQEVLFALTPNTQQRCIKGYRYDNFFILDISCHFCFGARNPLVHIWCFFQLRHWKIIHGFWRGRNRFEGRDNIFY